MKENTDVNCPNCGSTYRRALYDFEYIHCNSGPEFMGKGCGVVFNKMTGQLLAKTFEEYRAKTSYNKSHAGSFGKGIK